jgi:hypothetical protein
MTAFRLNSPAAATRGRLGLHHPPDRSYLLF